MDKILFAADLHGNTEQYRKVFAHAKQNGFDVVVFAGDLTPKEKHRRTPRLQRQFIEQELFPLLDERDPNDPHALFIMGNDDFSSNDPVMIDGQDFHRYRMIDNKHYETKSGLCLIGYSNVPYTPFIYKCRERRDLSTDTDFSHRDDILQTGFISRGFDLVDHELGATMMDHSIEEDLAKLTKGIDPRKLVLVSHAPPHDMVCDINHEGKHVGSRALRQFIEARQPYMTVSGHIHETVDKSGAFLEQINATTCITVGNSNNLVDPYVVEVLAAPNSPPKATRLAIK